jgi:hypothetical protein
MDIEVVEFYTMERNDEKQTLVGSLHVYLTEMDVDLRGVLVKKRKDSWYFELPFLFGKDPETKQKVKFPVFSFVNREKTSELRNVVRDKGKDYIIKNVLAKPQEKKA